jgi:hypothetical protein
VIAPISIDNGFFTNFSLVLKFLFVATFFELPDPYAGRLTRDFKQKDIWRATLRGCPEWMRKAQWALFRLTVDGFFALSFIYGAME